MKRLHRATRGLALGLSISVLNLVGMLLTITILGGLGEWSRVQFIGAFGFFEIATAFAFLFCPNIWRLPVIESETADRTRIRLAASVVFIRHWAGGAKAIAGVAMVGYCAWSVGLSAASALLLPLAFAVGVFVLAVSAIAARWGVARPDLDVVKVVIQRPTHKDLRLPGISLTAATLQIVLGALTLPAVKLLPPSAFFAPEFQPSSAVFVTAVLGAVAAVGLALWSWSGRIALDAPREQQKKAEEPV